MKSIINLNVKKISMKYSKKRYEIEMPSFKNEVLSNVYEMRPHLIYICSRMAYDWLSPLPWQIL